jgi:hypothetical protein
VCVAPAAFEYGYILPCHSSCHTDCTGEFCFDMLVAGGVEVKEQQRLHWVEGREASDGLL